MGDLSTQDLEHRPLFPFTPSLVKAYLLHILISKPFLLGHSNTKPLNTDSQTFSRNREAAFHIIQKGWQLFKRKFSVIEQCKGRGRGKDVFSLSKILKHGLMICWEIQSPKDSWNIIMYLVWVCGNPISLHENPETHDCSTFSLTKVRFIFQEDYTFLYYCFAHLKMIEGLFKGNLIGENLAGFLLDS